MQQIVIVTGLMLLIFAPVSGQVRDMLLTVSDGSAAVVLHFGLAPEATDGIDAGLGEMEIPPPPPAGVFDARFVHPAFGQGMTSDFRRGNTSTSAVYVHEVSWQTEEGKAIMFAWNLPSDVAVDMQDIVTGTLLNVTMTGTGAYTLVHPERFPRLRLIVHFRPVRIRIRAFLQGPFNAATASMNTSLRSAGILTARFRTEKIPVAAVDSIGIEIRNASAGVAATVRRYASAWLLADGTIRAFADTAGTDVMFDSVAAGVYYVVVRHRNHLAIMSAGRINLTTSPTGYDFTTARTRAYGPGSMKGLGVRGGPPFGLFAADGNANEVINAVDLNAVWRPQNGSINGYFAGDFNLSGTVNVTDQLSCWRGNNGIIGQVP